MDGEQKQQLSTSVQSLDEAKIIKEHFKDNDDFLKVLRAYFFGIKLTDAQYSDIKRVFSNEEVLEMIRLRFCPDVMTQSFDMVIGGVNDEWFGTEAFIQGAPEFAVKQGLDWKSRQKDTTKMMIEGLRNPKQVDVLTYNREIDTDGSLLLARNQYMRHIDMQLMYLKIVANNESLDKQVNENGTDPDSAE